MRVLIPLSLLLFVRCACAGEVYGLYNASVESEAASATPEAVQAALEQVLVKLTGRRDVRTINKIDSVFEKAESYVQQYQKQEDAAGAEQGVAMLNVEFDPATLDQALRERDIPVWGRMRPVTVLWLAMEQAGERQLLGADAPVFSGVAAKQAGERGIPVVLPLMDLEDASSIDPSDIWGGFGEPVIQASKRYRADATLTGILEEAQAGYWDSRWSLYLGDERNSWAFRAQHPEQLVANAIDRLADFLQTRFTLKVESNKKVEMEITVQGVSNAHQYTSVQQYLESIDEISQVEVVSVAADVVIYRIVVLGGAPTVNRVVSLGDVLSAVSDDGTVYKMILP